MVEFDALFVIQALKVGGMERSIIGRILQNIHELEDSLSVRCFVHTYR